MVDHHVVDGTAGCGEAQAELGAQGVKECGKVALLGCKRVGGRVGRKDGAEAEREVVVAGEARLVDDGTAVVLHEQRQEPSEINHRDADSRGVLGAAVDRDLVVFRRGVGLHLETGRIDGEGVDIALAGVVMKAQAEAVDEKVLVHGVKVVDGVGTVGASFDVEALSGDPIGGTFDLPEGDLVHQRNHQANREVLRGVAVIAGDGLDAASLRVGVCGMNGDDVEGEAWAGRLCEKDGRDEEGGEFHAEIVARRYGLPKAQPLSVVVGGEKQIPFFQDVEFPYLYMKALAEVGIPSPLFWTKAWTLG